MKQDVDDEVGGAVESYCRLNGYNYAGEYSYFRAKTESNPTIDGYENWLGCV